MLSSDAKVYVGQYVEVEFRDRSKKLHVETVEVYDIGFLPSFGPCLITDIGEIRLDRVLSCTRLEIDNPGAA